MQADLALPRAARVPNPSAPSLSPTPEELTRARRRLGWVAALIWIGGFTSAAWDGWWHTQNTFDGFWSPPHVLGYVTALICVYVVSGMVFNRSYRAAFGQGFRILILPYPVPGALFILTGGLAVLGFAGVVLDNIWHSTFGLDETGWSMPHAMIGVAFLLITLGLIACFLALERARGQTAGQNGQGKKHRSWLASLFYGWLVCIFFGGLLMGPIGANNTPEVAAARGEIPVIAAQPDALRGVQVLLVNNLNRTNPLFMVLAPLALGAGLAFARRLDGRTWVFLGLALILSGADRSAQDLSEYVPALLESRTNSAANPAIVLAGVYAILRLVRLHPRIAWGIAGVLFSLLVGWVFVARGGEVEVADGVWLLALLGGLAAAVGSAWGERVYAVVSAPFERGRVVGMMVIFAIVAPVLVGLVDLYWRNNVG